MVRLPGWYSEAWRITTAVTALVVGGITVSAPLPVRASPSQPPGASHRQVVTPPIVPWPSPTPVNDVGPAPADAWRIADTGGLPARVRSGPSIAAPVVLRLDPGTVVEPLGETAAADGYRWRRISADGTLGWIADSLLLEPTAPPTAAVSVVAAVGELGLNVREQPSTASSIVASLSEGTVVEPVSGPVEAEGRAWLQVRAEAVTGWVIASAITQR